MKCKAVDSTSLTTTRFQLYSQFDVCSSVIVDRNISALGRRVYETVEWREVCLAHQGKSNERLCWLVRSNYQWQLSLSNVLFRWNGVPLSWLLHAFLVLRGCTVVAWTPCLVPSQEPIKWQLFACLFHYFKVYACLCFCEYLVWQGCKAHSIVLSVADQEKCFFQFQVRPS